MHCVNFSTNCIIRRANSYPCSIATAMLLQLLLRENTDERVKVCYTVITDVQEDAGLLSFEPCIGPVGESWLCDLQVLWGLWVVGLDPMLGVKASPTGSLQKPFCIHVWVALPPPESQLQLPQPLVRTCLSLNLAVK